MWDRSLHRIALLELAITGKLNKRQDQEEAWNELHALRWARRASRQHELVVADEHRGKIEDLLGKMWPGWRSIAADLIARGLPPTRRGLQQLEDLQRQATLTAPLPQQLNQRTATAAVGPHSKAVLTEQRRLALGDTDLTRDGIVRVRPHAGLQLRRADALLPLEAHRNVLGEVALPERALQSGLGDRPVARGAASWFTVARSDERAAAPRSGGRTVRGAVRGEVSGRAACGRSC